MTTNEETALTKRRFRGRTLSVLGAAAVAVALAPSTWADDWSNLGLQDERGRFSAERSGASFGPTTWQHALTGEEQPSYRGLLASPAVADGFVTFATQRNLVRTLRESDGTLVWQAQAGGAIYASPALWRGFAFVLGMNQELVALRLADGSEVWKRDLGASGYSSPIVAGGSLFVTTGAPNPRVFRVDARTGQIHWQSEDGKLKQAALASVAVADGQVLVGEMGGRYHSFAADDGRHRWTATLSGAVSLSSPMVAGGRVYLVPGGEKAQLHALDLQTGTPVTGWPLDLELPGHGSGTLLSRRVLASSLAGGGETLVFALRLDDRVDSDGNGRVDRYRAHELVVGVDPANRRLLWTKDNGLLDVGREDDLPTHGFVPSPAMFRSQGAESLVAVTSSTSARLRVLGGADGRELWAIALSGPSRSSPVFANGRLVVATDAGVVHSFLSRVNAPPVAPSLGFVPSADQSVDPRRAGLTLRWGAAFDPDGDAVGYEVRLDDDGEILTDWDLLITTVPLQQSLDVGAQLEMGRRYVFAVRARDSRGAYSAWSRTESFRTVETPEVKVDGRPTSGLADAVGQARAGQRITLGAGEFPLSSVLELPPGVTLAGAGPHLTTLQGKGLAVAVAAAAGSALTSLTVAGAGIGVKADGVDIRLRNVILRDNHEAGLDVPPSASAEIVSGTLVRNGSGVRAAGLTKVRNALILQNQVGLEATAANAIESRYNNVFGNPAGDYRNVSPGTTDLAQAVTFLLADVADLRLKAAQPTTDRGDPADDFALEPLPNGKRINIGAFGNTVFAELSPTTGTDPDPPAPMATDGGVPPPAGSQPDAGAPPSPEEPGGSGGENEPARLRGGGGCATGGSGPGDTGWLGLVLAAAALAFSRRRRPPSRGIG